ncbi:MAG: hypothetical protein K5629_03695 [Eubacteriales bacterium]|nr:hypothetical protein [Eubacteriales bacterium]
MRNKRIIALLLAFTLLLGFSAGCRRNGEEEGGDKPDINPPELPVGSDETLAQFLSSEEPSYTLASDMAEDVGTIMLKKGKTIDLNGYSLVLSGRFQFTSYGIVITDSAAGETNTVDLTGLAVEKSDRQEMIDGGEDFFLVILSIAKDASRVKGISLPNSPERYTETYAEDSAADSVSFSYEYLTPQTYSQLASQRVRDFLSGYQDQQETLEITEDTSAYIGEIMLSSAVNITVADGKTLALTGDITFNGGSIGITLGENSHLDLTGISPELYNFDELEIGRTYITVFYDSLLGANGVRLAEYAGWDLIDNGTSLSFNVSADYGDEF